LKKLADRESHDGSSKRLKTRVFSKPLFVSKEATVALSEHFSYSLLIYSIKSMLSYKEKYSDLVGEFQA